MDGKSGKQMERQPRKEGAERYGRRRSHARPDRIIDKRPKWQDYLDPDEDPGLLGEEELLAAPKGEEGVEEVRKEEEREESEE